MYTGDKQKNQDDLEIISTDSLENKTVVVANNKSGNIAVKVEMAGTFHSNLPARHMVGLWNEYQNLPYHLQLSPAMIFQLLRTADEQDLSEEVRLLKDENESVKWWNRIYRNAIFLCIVGFIIYSQIKH